MRSLERELRLGEFNTKCGHQVSISEVKRIEGKYEGYKRLVVKGEKVNALNLKSKTCYFWTWKELEFELINLFGYIPEIDEWITEGSENKFKFINWERKPTDSGYRASFEQVCTINGKKIRIIDLAHEILKEDKLEYSAQSLLNRIFEHFFIKVGVFSEEEIKEKIHVINSAGVKKISIQGSEEVIFSFEMSWRDLKAEMEDLPEIKVRGDKRGRLYRHISTRPRLPDRLIANLLTLLMKKLEPEFAEVDRSDMYSRLAGQLMSLHYFIETNIASLVPPIKMSEEQMISYKEGVNDLASELKVDSLMEEYFWEYDDDFQEWALKTYTREWFLQSWGNISLEMKKFGARPGTKRGTWTMNPKPKKQQTLRQSTQDILKLIEKLEKEITRISKESQDKESVLDIGITGLTSSIKRLEKKKINFDKND
jgi:hypothetical protein